MGSPGRKARNLSRRRRFPLGSRTAAATKIRRQRDWPYRSDRRRRAGCETQRLKAWAKRDGVSGEKHGAGQECDADGLRIDRAQILRPFPNPQRHGWKRGYVRRMNRIPGSYALAGHDTSKDEPGCGQRRSDENGGDEAQMDHAAHEWQLCRQLHLPLFRPFQEPQEKPTTCVFEPSCVFQVTEHILNCF